MKRLILLFVFAPALASAQVRVGATFSLDLPVVVPPLVVIQPGIQVVPDVEYEVFFVNGFYWTRHDGGWYRSGNPRSGWVYYPRGVPPGLTRLPPGHYKHWRPAAGPPPGPAFRGPERGERFERRDVEHDRGGHGRGRGHGKHDD